jgi:hypothetical protein
MRRRALAFARLLAAGAFCWIALRLVAMIRYPFGGGEFHAIFAYPEATFNAARGVFLTYLTTAAAGAAFLIVVGYRVSWWAIAAIASVVCLDAWWQVCSFEYGYPEVREPAVRLLPVIPVVIVLVACLAHRGRDLVRAGILALSACLVSGCMPATGPELRPNPMEDPAAQAVVGCWRLEPLGWQHAFLPGPTLIRFDSTFAAYPRNDRSLVLRSLNPERDAPRRFRLASWGVRERDGRIHAAYGTGFAGLRFEFVLENGLLQGKARTFTDTWPQFSRGGHVRGTSITCPASMPAPAAEPGGVPGDAP